MHGLIPRLAPLSLDTLGLAATLEGPGSRLAAPHPNMALSLRHELRHGTRPQRHFAIYRVVQEGLINALRTLMHRDRHRGAMRCPANRRHSDRRGVGLATDGRGRGILACVAWQSVCANWGARSTWRQGWRGVRITATFLECTGMIRVLLVDDHAVVRMGFRLLLESTAEMSSSPRLTRAKRVPALLRVQPDVVVMDLAMPGMGGLEALRRIRARHAQHRY